MKEQQRWLIVAGYAVAMAWVEAAVVYYLRTLINRIDPFQPDPLPLVAGLCWVELVREGATLLMLLGVGVLAGRNWHARWGYAAVAFGVWDIFYYVFLKAMTGWPHSLLNWDILFLLPLPWWGPVIAPVLIAVLMIVWGTMASQGDHGDWQPLSEWPAWALNFCGIAVALGVFMSDALGVASQGEGAIRKILPTNFAWGWFGVSLVLMSAPILDLVRRGRRKKPSAAWPGLAQAEQD